MSERLDETVGALRVRCAAASIASGTGPTVFAGDLRLDVPAFLGGQRVEVPVRIPQADRARLAGLIAPPPLSPHDLAQIERQAAEACARGLALTTIPPEVLAGLAREVRDGRAAQAVLDDLEAGR